MSSRVGKDAELDAVGSRFEPRLTAGCVCMRVARLRPLRRPCGVAWDAAPEQSRLLKRRRKPACRTIIVSAIIVLTIIVLTIIFDHYRSGRI